MLELILFVICAFLLQASYCLWRRRRLPGKWPRRALLLGMGMAVLLGMVVFAAAIGLTWYRHRPRPRSVTRPLFEGITYTRDVRDTPRPIVIHVISVDLAAPGIGFLVTPAETNGAPLLARTTSEFVKEYGVQVAINANYFDPCETKSLFDYRPRSGEPVAVLGTAISQGRTYSTGSRDDHTLFFAEDNRVQIGTPSFEIYNAVSGSPLILKDGVVAPNLTATLHPRTSVALDRAKETLLLIVVDGRQPSYSEGVTLQELAEIALEYGAHAALNLDGGGSSAIVIAPKPSKVTCLNWPVHTGVPGRERPVANHLGITATRLSD